MGFGTVSRKAAPRVPLRHGEGNKDHLTSLGGLAALSLDALSSVAYGPEAIVLVLVAAGASALRLTLPVTLAIAGLLVVLILASYTTPGDLNDLDAILDRHSEEETADIRRILAVRRAA
jgi:hypothetical protein